MLVARGAPATLLSQNSALASSGTSFLPIRLCFREMGTRYSTRASLFEEPGNCSCSCPAEPPRPPPRPAEFSEHTLVVRVSNPALGLSAAPPPSSCRSGLSSILPSRFGPRHPVLSREPGPPRTISPNASRSPPWTGPVLSRLCTPGTEKALGVCAVTSGRQCRSSGGGAGQWPRGSGEQEPGPPLC